MPLRTTDQGMADRVGDAVFKNLRQCLTWLLGSLW
jgi:hypothetical protein